ncbi:bleomycin resistance protein [Methylobacterium sp. ID0610]|uniref:bleomycin resistance protein n=1 Tax=Methylobacterium carpenticola TaxID=3344827 RepID=UPI0036B43C90
MPAMLIRARLVPELLVADLSASLAFWVGLIGFRIADDRPEDGFAYLDLDGAQVMLEERDPVSRQWVTGPLDPPLGRGINFQISVPDAAPVIARLEAAGRPPYMACEERWYRADTIEVGVRQFLVQDPDGYLLRVSSRLGQRPLRAAV